MAGLDLVTAPTAEPISIEDVMLHARIDADDERMLLEGYIAAARQSIETFLNQSLLATVWRCRLDWCFPWEIRLPIGPVLDSDAVSVVYIDTAGAQQTLDPALYQVSLGETGVLRPAYGQTWPAVQRQLDAVSVTFTAGWTDGQALLAARPAYISALRQTVATLYKFREDAVAGQLATELPLPTRNLLIPFVRFD